MKQRPRFVKDKKVRVFKATTRAVWGFEKVFKFYLHPESSGGLWAHVRHLSGAEVLRARQVQSNETVQFVVSYFPGITSEVYFEFGDKTYKAVSIDAFEYNKTDFTIRASETSPPAYDEVEWEAE